MTSLQNLQEIIDTHNPDDIVEVEGHKFLVGYLKYFLEYVTSLGYHSDAIFQIKEGKINVVSKNLRDRRDLHYTKKD